MHSNLENGAVLAKTRELCETIVSQPEFAQMRGNIEKFLADDEAKRLYQTVAEKSEQLQYQQHQGVQISDAEIASFEQQREALLQNDVARAFLDAQQTMHTMQETVSRYVTKTFEIGRVPEPEDLQSCGHGCSCGH